MAGGASRWPAREARETEGTGTAEADARVRRRSRRWQFDSAPSHNSDLTLIKKITTMQTIKIEIGVSLDVTDRVMAAVGMICRGHAPSEAQPTPECAPLPEPLPEPGVRKAVAPMAAPAPEKEPESAAPCADEPQGEPAKAETAPAAPPRLTLADLADGDVGRAILERRFVPADETEGKAALRKVLDETHARIAALEPGYAYKGSAREKQVLACFRQAATKVAADYGIEGVTKPSQLPLVALRSFVERATLGIVLNDGNAALSNLPALGEGEAAPY